VTLVGLAFVASAAGAPVYGTSLSTGGVAAAEVGMASVVGTLKWVFIVRVFGPIGPIKDGFFLGDTSDVRFVICVRLLGFGLVISDVPNVCLVSDIVIVFIRISRRVRRWLWTEKS
jgi:hypothetical protein